MIDVHAQLPRFGRLSLRRVGVTGIKKPLAVQRADRVITLTASFAVAVDLPSDRKGSDLSRNAELLAELVDATATRPVASLESACSEIAGELLRRHPYAKVAEVSASAEYFLARGISEDRRSYEDYLLLAEARAVRNGEGIELFRAIGAEAVGMTACPCAMSTCRERLEKEFPLLADPSLKDLPIITHNQRNRTRLVFDLPPRVEIEADAILDAIEEGQSSPTFAILKRGDEATVVLNAHRNPKFVEDVLRSLLSGVVRRFPQLPPEVNIRASTVSEESIHKYDVMAANELTLGDLRRQVAA
ncbi:MAG: GTP cyclohydrolase MptA [Thermoplasmata archaeon]|nr:GTP cyclohydrolase MptA [Thermoplasmata archaeon]